MKASSWATQSALTALACLAVVAFDTPASAQLNFVAGPQNAWAYYEGPSGHAGMGPDGHLWYPTRIDQFCPATNRDVRFHGYVDYSLPQIPTEPGWWGGQDDVEYGMYHIFCTHVWSETDLLLPIYSGGDDGSSIFLDGVFLGGVPFAGELHTTLRLTGGQLHTLVLAGNNALGPWIFSLGRLQDRLSIQSTPGVRIGASEHCIPEPAGVAVMAVGLLSLLGLVCYPRRRT